MVGLLGIAILLALMFLVELPVGLAMGLVGLGGLWYLLGLEAGCPWWEPSCGEHFLLMD